MNQKLNRALIQASMYHKLTARDWNAEFQALWEATTITSAAASKRWNLLCDLVHEFTQVATDLVIQVTQQMYSESSQANGSDTASTSSNGLSIPPLSGGYPGCFRAGNVLIRRWASDRGAKQQQQAFRTILMADVPGLCVPLTVVVGYQGSTFTVQGLLPLSKNSRIVYRGDGQQDTALNKPVHAMVRRLMDSLNLIADGPNAATAEQWKLPRVEIIEGEDGRFYMTNALGLLPPLLPGVTNSPSRRYESLVLIDTPAAFSADRSHATEMGSVLFFRTASPLFAISPSDAASEASRQQQVIDVMRKYGLNVTLLGMMFQLVPEEESLPLDRRQTALAIFCVEMMCRTAKALLLTDISKIRDGPDPQSISFERCVSTALQYLVGDDDVSFAQRLFLVTCRKFDLSPEKDEGVLSTFKAARRGRRKLLVKRFCDLCGVTLSASEEDRVPRCDWSPIVDRYPFLPVALETVDEATLKSIASPARLHAFGLPHAARRHLCKGEVEQALQACSLVAADRKSHFTKESVHWVYAAQMLATCQVLAGRTEGGVVQFLEAIKIMKSLAGTNCILIGKMYSQLGDLLFEEKRFQLALIQFANAVKSYDELPHPLAKFGPIYMHALQGVLAAHREIDVQQSTQPGAANRPSAANIPLLSNGVTKLALKAHPDAAVHAFVMDYASIVMNEQMYEVAAEMLNQASTLAEAVYGASAPQTAATLSAAAYAYYCAGPRFVKQCEGLMEKAIEVTSAAHGKASLETAIAMNNLGSLFLQEQRFEEAYRQFVAAQQRFERAASTDEPNYKVCRRNVAILLNRMRLRAAIKIQIYVRRFLARAQRKKDLRTRERFRLEELETKARTMELVETERSARSAIKREFVETKPTDKIGRHGGVTLDPAEQNLSVSAEIQQSTTSHDEQRVDTSQDHGKPPPSPPRKPDAKKPVEPKPEPPSPSAPKRPEESKQQQVSSHPKRNETNQSGTTNKVEKDSPPPPTVAPTEPAQETDNPKVVRRLSIRRKSIGDEGDADAPNIQAQSSSSAPPPPVVIEDAPFADSPKQGAPSNTAGDRRRSSASVDQHELTRYMQHTDSSRRKSLTIYDQQLQEQKRQEELNKKTPTATPTAAATPHAHLSPSYAKSTVSSRRKSLTDMEIFPQAIPPTSVADTPRAAITPKAQQEVIGLMPRKKAINILQRIGRAYRIRKRLALQRLRTLQRMGRGFLVRKMMFNKKHIKDCIAYSAASMLSRFVRVRRSVSVRQLKAAKVLLRFVRGYKARRRMADIHERSLLDQAKAKVAAIVKDETEMRADLAAEERTERKMLHEENIAIHGKMRGERQKRLVREDALRELKRKRLELLDDEARIRTQLENDAVFKLSQLNRRARRQKQMLSDAVTGLKLRDRLLLSTSQVREEESLVVSDAEPTIADPAAEDPDIEQHVSPVKSQLGTMVVASALDSPRREMFGGFVVDDTLHAILDLERQLLNFRWKLHAKHNNLCRVIDDVSDERKSVQRQLVSHNSRPQVEQPDLVMFAPARLIARSYEREPRSRPPTERPAPSSSTLPPLSQQPNSARRPSGATAAAEAAHVAVVTSKTPRAPGAERTTPRNLYDQPYMRSYSGASMSSSRQRSASSSQRAAVQKV